MSSDPVEKKKKETINLGDSASLKQAVDTVVVEVWRNMHVLLKFIVCRPPFQLQTDRPLQTVSNAGYKVNYIVTDTKIGVGILAISLALLAQFYPSKFPANFWLLVGCVSAYATLSFVLTLIALFWEKDAIAFTNESDKRPSLVISSKLPKYKDEYILKIALKVEGNAANCADETSGVTLKKSVANYFTKEGEIVPSRVKEDVLRSLKDIEKTRE